MLGKSLVIPTVVLAVMGCLLADGGYTTAASRPHDPTVTFEMRLLAASPSEGTIEAVNPTTGQPIYLQREVALDNRDIASAEVDAEEPTPAIWLHLTERGFARMDELAREHVFEPVAVVVNGQVVAVPYIAPQDPDDPTPVRTTLSPVQAEQVAAALHR